MATIDDPQPSVVKLTRTEMSDEQFIHHQKYLEELEQHKSKIRNEREQREDIRIFENQLVQQLPHVMGPQVNPYAIGLTK